MWSHRLFVSTTFDGQNTLYDRWASLAQSKTRLVHFWEKMPTNYIVLALHHILKDSVSIDSESIELNWQCWILIASLTCWKWELCHVYYSSTWDWPNFLASGKLYYIDLSQEAMPIVPAAGRENHTHVKDWIPLTPIFRCDNTYCMKKPQFREFDKVEWI